MWELESLGPESDSGPGAAQVRSVQLAEGVPTRPFAGRKIKQAGKTLGGGFLS